jgi:predicted dehydrogenase
MLVASAQSAAPQKRRVCIIGDTQHGGYGHDLHTVWLPRADVEVAALADPDEAGRMERAAQAGAQRTYADYREMIEKEKPDIVTVGPRWTMRHREYLLAAAACGAHGFMEKPVAADLAEADEMMADIEQKNLQWAIAFNWRTMPIVRHAHRLIVREKILGDILELRGRGKEDARAGGEDLIVLGTHVFDLMRYFAGDPQWCMADITVDGRPAVIADVRQATEPIGPILGNSLNASYGFANGITATFSSVHGSKQAPGRWGLDVYCTEGVVLIRFESGGATQVRMLRDPSWSPGFAKANFDPLPDAPPPEIDKSSAVRYAPIINDLLAAIGENRRPEVSLQDGRAALEMVVAIYAAHLRGRVTLPLQDRKHPLVQVG